MKGFFTTFLVVCAVLAAAWFGYEPYLKPLIDRIGGGSSLSDDNKVITKSTGTPTAPPVKPSSVPAKPAVLPTASAPTTPAPAPVATKSELELALEAKYPLPEILPLLTIVDQWRNVPPNAYPPEVTAKETIPFQLIINGQAVGSSNVAPGTPLKPVRLTGDQLTVAALANPGMSTQIAVGKTDFVERIEARYAQFVAAKLKDVEVKRERARQIIAADPARLAVLTGKPVPGAAPVSDGSDPRIAPVKESLRKGEAASVTLEEAKSFQWNGSEKVGGEYAGSYDTVTVHFEVATIFGRFPTEYKALLRGGKVVGWIDPISEDRI